MTPDGDRGGDGGDPRGDACDPRRHGRSVSRRSFLRVAAAAAVATGTAARSRAAAAGSWPHVGRDAGHTSHVRASPPSLPASGVCMAPAWRDPPGVMLGSPVVADGRVYAGRSGEAVDGPQVAAYGLASGAVDWTASIDGGLRGSPSYGDGRLVVAPFSPTVDCLDAATGERLWRIDAGFASTGSPVLRDGTVYVAGYRIDRERTGALTALDLATGARRWEARFDGRVRSTPAVAGDTVVVTTADEIHCCRVRDGATRWSRPIGGSNDPVVAGNDVHVLSDGVLRVLDRRTGVERWRLEGATAPPAVTDAAVVVPGDGRLTARARDAGGERWSRRLPDAAAVTATVAGDTVFAAAGDGRLAVLDRATGKRRSHLDVSSAIAAPIAVAEHHLLVGGDGALRVYPLELAERAACDPGDPDGGPLAPRVDDPVRAVTTAVRRHRRGRTTTDEFLHALLESLPPRK